MATLILTDHDVRALLPMAECIEVMADALRHVAEGSAVLPLRTVLRTGDNNFLSMPAIVGSSLGAKVISVFPGNHATPYDAHIGVVLLFDGENGRLLAIADASSITAIRTSAVSGLATRLLAQEESSTLAILGGGVLALPHLEAVCAVRPIRQVRVWSRSGARAEAFAARVPAGLDVIVAASAQAAVEGADIVCTLTASHSPILEGRWLSPGTHVNAVGASLKTARELDSPAVASGRFFADRRESVMAESGDFLIPLAEGAIRESHLLGELGELVTGRIAGRTSPTEITIFKSLGLAVEDVAALRHIHERALATGRGLPVELGGLRH